MPESKQETSHTHKQNQLFTLLSTISNPHTIPPRLPARRGSSSWLLANVGCAVGRLFLVLWWGLLWVVGCDIGGGGSGGVGEGREVGGYFVIGDRF